MAIIRSIAVGKAKKSAGNVTFRTVRGRTIMSEKVGERTTTRGPRLTVYEARFKLISMYIGMHRSSINVSFNKTKYGSQGNYFYKVNKAALEAAVAALVNDAESATPEMVEAAVTAYAKENPTSIYRVKLSGFDVVYLTDAWNDDDNPISGGATDALGVGSASVTAGENTYTAPIALSMSFRAGAKIVRPAGSITLSAAALPAGVTAADIKFTTSNGNVVPDIAITEVTSNAGSLKYTTGEITAANNALGILVKGIYIRLTSAYVQGGNVDENPFG